MREALLFVPVGRPVVQPLAACRRSAPPWPSRQPARLGSMNTVTRKTANNEVRLSLENYSKFDREDAGADAGEEEDDDLMVLALKRKPKKPTLASVGQIAQYEREREPEPEVRPIYDEKAEKREKRKLRIYVAKRVSTLAYLVVIGVGCFAFQFFGCFEMANGPHRFALTVELGVGWCCAFGGGVAANLYVTLPMSIWVMVYYDCALALRLVVQGALLGTGYAFLLALGLQGKDPPPGYGVNGVPAGGALVAGLATLALHSVAAFLGYYRNARLGRTCTRAAAYLIVCVSLGTLAAFELNLFIGLGVAVTLFFAMGWTAQVWVTTAIKRITLGAYLAPLVIGAAFGIPVEFVPERFGMPPTSGYGIACGVAFSATVLLSHAFETRGIAGARQLALLLLIQDLIGLASWIAGYFLSPASGVLMVLALEILLGGTISVALREGNQFGAWQ